MRVRYRSEALHDLEAICNYIAADNPKAARSVVHRLRSAAERLSMFPRSGRKGSVRGTFELIVPKLPYIVVYQIVRSQGPEFVDIIAVVHGARRLRR